MLKLIKFSFFIGAIGLPYHSNAEMPDNCIIPAIFEISQANDNQASIDRIVSRIESDPTSQECSFKSLEPMHYAAAAREAEIVSALLEAGADPGALTPAGFSPLSFAVQEDSPVIMKILIDAGADVELTDEFGRNLIHLATIYNAPKALDFLLEQTTLTPQTYMKCDNLYHLAAFNNSLDILTFLLSSDVIDSQMNEKNEFSATPLDLSLIQNNMEFAHNLEQQGARNGLPDELLKELKSRHALLHQISASQDYTVQLSEETTSQIEDVIVTYSKILQRMNPDLEVDLVSRGLAIQVEELGPNVLIPKILALYDAGSFHNTTELAFSADALMNLINPEIATAMRSYAVTHGLAERWVSADSFRGDVSERRKLLGGIAQLDFQVSQEFSSELTNIHQFEMRLAGQEYSLQTLNLARTKENLERSADVNLARSSSGDGINGLDGSRGIVSNQNGASMGNAREEKFNSSLMRGGGAIAVGAATAQPTIVGVGMVEVAAGTIEYLTSSGSSSPKPSDGSNRDGPGGANGDKPGDSNDNGDGLGDGNDNGDRNGGDNDPPEPSRNDPPDEPIDPPDNDLGGCRGMSCGGSREAELIMIPDDPTGPPADPCPDCGGYEDLLRWRYEPVRFERDLFKIKTFGNLIRSSKIADSKFILIESQVRLDDDITTLQ
ncbi:MAG: ankyrin repeat domain-containing protein [Wenzhouxiangellaceae bacterium]